MGLDMYLTKRTYIGAEYDHNKISGTVEIFKDGVLIPIDFKKVTYINETAGYWRKANAIHSWFVENVQEGEDDCKEYDVSMSQLEALLNECKKVLANKSKAPKILATKPGFFFGNQEYNEGYFEDIQDTVKFIEELLKYKTDKGYLPFDVSYCASW